ncbi:hypothetical protein [Pseudomonas sp. 2FE]|uniref:hypothetical protein n=1 Tax=Pseudomonas sp. 2FE TaxID=2502190 RepID=UPI0010F8771C|nr:hypothetical protein [Pseudomonas sp. 2FE]
MSHASQKFHVRLGLGRLEGLMTKQQARSWGDRNIPSDLKSAGFSTCVFESCPEIHGALFLRISYGKSCPSR